MTLCKRFLGNGVGAKSLVAITGLLLTGFVLTHLSGNLLVFAGRDAINEYSAKLKSLGAILWLLRGGLLVTFVAHLSLAIRLNIANRAARPQGYAFEKTMKASFASRHMVLSGLMLLAFILYHLAHYTFRVANADIAAIPETDVYGMIVTGFSSPIVSGFYIFSMAVLALHLQHGVSSVFQTLGVNHPNMNGVISKLGPVVAVLVFVGFSSIPIAVLTGCLQ